LSVQALLLAAAQQSQVVAHANLPKVHSLCRRSREKQGFRGKGNWLGRVVDIRHILQYSEATKQILSDAKTRLWKDPAEYAEDEVHPLPLLKNNDKILLHDVTLQKINKKESTKSIKRINKKSPK